VAEIHSILYQCDEVTVVQGEGNRVAGRTVQKKKESGVK
jgi:hypothetical protein